MDLWRLQILLLASVSRAESDHVNWSFRKITCYSVWPRLRFACGAKLAETSLAPAGKR